MMALPHAQYVIAEASTPVSGVNSNQVKTVSNIVVLIHVHFQDMWLCFRRSVCSKSLTLPSSWIVQISTLKPHLAILPTSSESIFIRKELL